MLKQYWIHLGTTRQRLGSIDLVTGFNHSLINSVVKNCEYINSVDYGLLGILIFGTILICNDDHEFLDLPK